MESIEESPVPNDAPIVNLPISIEHPSAPTATQLNAQQEQIEPINSGETNSNVPSLRPVHQPYLPKSFYVICLCIIAVVFYMTRDQPRMAGSTSESSSTATISVSPSTSAVAPSVGADLPKTADGWVYTHSNDCGVSVAVLPKNLSSANQKDTGIDRYWNFPRGSVYPNMLSKIFEVGQSYQTTAAMYVSDTDASGEIPSAVAISCIPNTNNYTNKTLLDAIFKNISAYNLKGSGETMEALTYRISSYYFQTHWNVPTVDLTVSEYFPNPGGKAVTNTQKYTIFATPKMLYEVRILGTTKDTLVQDTAKKIFDSLVFDTL